MGRVHRYRLPLLDVVLHCKLPAMGDSKVRHDAVMCTQRVRTRDTMMLLGVLLRDVTGFNPLRETDLALLVTVETAHSCTPRAEYDFAVVEGPSRRCDQDAVRDVLEGLEAVLDFGRDV